MRVIIAGYGTGGESGCLPEVQRELETAGLVLGAPRLLKSAGVEPPRGVEAISAAEMATIIHASHVEPV